MKIRVDSGHALESQKGSETRLVWKWKPKALSFIPRETCSIDFYEYLSLSLNNWIAFSGFTPSTVVELKDQKNCTTTLYISKALLSGCVLVVLLVWHGKCTFQRLPYISLLSSVAYTPPRFSISLCSPFSLVGYFQSTVHGFLNSPYSSLLIKVCPYRNFLGEGSRSRVIWIYRTKL